MPEPKAYEFSSTSTHCAHDGARTPSGWAKLAIDAEALCGDPWHCSQRLTAGRRRIECLRGVLHSAVKFVRVFVVPAAEDFARECGQNHGLNLTLVNAVHAPFIYSFGGKIVILEQDHLRQFEPWLATCTSFR
jgi:hypothetical protein